MEQAKKQMCDCGKQAICSMGKQLLCVEHLPDGLIRCGAVTMLGEKTGKKSIYPQVYQIKEDFLNACKEKDKERSAK